MSPRGAALAVTLGAFVATAQVADDRPLREPEPQALQDDDPLRWRRFVVPVLEGATLHLAMLAFNNLVTHMAFAQITPKTVQHNLDPRAWTFDVDYYLTNQFGHPYQGALHFNAARSSGLSFWWGALYAALGSLAWELFFEAEPPSMNDQITTTIGGSLLGEALHRAAADLRGGDGPGWLRVLGATLLDPMGALNAELVEPRAVEDITLDPLFVRWQLGASASFVLAEAQAEPRDRTPAQVLLAVLLVSGPPWDARSTYDAPLSYFDLRADLSFPSKVVGNAFIRGLLVGRRFGANPGPLRGVWGLFGDYDYAAPAIVRASAVGLGPGTVFQLELAPRLSLQVGGLFGLSPFAAAGQLDVSPDLARDYHVGPGLQSMVDLRLVHAQWLQLELVVRHWLVVGAYLPPSGFESLLTTALGLNVMVWRGLGVGGEFILSDRRATFAGALAEHDTGFAFRLTASLSSAPVFGVR